MCIRDRPSIARRSRKLRSSASRTGKHYFAKRLRLCDGKLPWTAGSNRAGSIRPISEGSISGLPSRLPHRPIWKTRAPGHPKNQSRWRRDRPSHRPAKDAGPRRLPHRPVAKIPCSDGTGQSFAGRPPPAVVAVAFCLEFIRFTKRPTHSPQLYSPSRPTVGASLAPRLPVILRAAYDR